MKRILMIDDSRDDCVQVSEYLDASVFVIEHESSPLVGVRRARDDCPDLIVLDIQMELLDGFGVINRLQNDDRTKRIPIVIFSIVGEDDATQLRSLGLGVDQTVDKRRKGALQLLEARIENILLKEAENESRSLVRKYQVGDHWLEVHGKAVSVVRDGKQVMFTKGQRAIVAKLSESAPNPVQRDVLYEYYYGVICGESDVHILQHFERFYRYMHGIRQRIEPDPRKPIFLRNQRDTGYYLDGLVR